MKGFCIYCLKDVGVRIEKHNAQYTFKDKSLDKERTVNYIEKRTYCNICGNEISIPNVSDDNLNSLYEAYYKQCGYGMEMVNKLTNKETADI